MIVKAVLVKTSTKDGLINFHGDIELGKEYYVDLNSIQEVGGIHMSTQTVWSREMVWDIEGGWLPTEVLKFTIPR